MNGGIWLDNGGHHLGRKLPILMAGILFNDTGMLNITDGTKNRLFQEDLQTWYVTQDDVGRPLLHTDGNPRVEYIQEDLGIAEWGEKHTTSPARDGRNWDTSYRDIVGSSILGHILVARLLEGETIWNWPALFDYSDRYWEIEKSIFDANSINPFTRSMWYEYSECAKNQQCQ